MAAAAALAMIAVAGAGIVYFFPGEASTEAQRRRAMLELTCDGQTLRPSSDVEECKVCQFPARPAGSCIRIRPQIGSFGAEPTRQAPRPNTAAPYFTSWTAYAPEPNATP